MSYILEALKKSQQERELGRVPTLDTLGVFEEDKVAPARSPWPVLAVGLAALAMMVALYAALRGPPPVAELPPLVGTTGGTSSPTALARGPEDSQPLPTAPQSASAPVPVAPELEASPGTSPPMPRTSGAPTGPGATLRLSQPPLIEPPPLKQSGRVRIPDPGGGVSNRGDPQGSDPEPIASLNPDEELALQRQLEADLAESWDPAEPMEPAPTPVPRDLIADIEHFKREVRGGRVPEKTASQPLSKLIDKDPLSLRLTPAQAAEVPAFLMTVHVYDADRGRRFVVINGVKYREGEKTREGLTVERILAQGAVLSHKGEPFFVAR